MRAMRALTLAIAAIALLAGSCSSMLGVDDYKDSTSELCDLLDACYNYENCESKIGGSLDSASASDRTLWLASVSDKGCLEQCSAARRCLNIKPVCSDFGKTCKRKEECCGFLSGKAECDGKCCRAKGAQCTSQADCCQDTICDPRTNTCGGVICSAVGQLCKNDFDCCTEICDGNICREGICTPVGSACNEDTDICCDNSECLSGVCGFTPSCRTTNQLCLLDSGGNSELTCCQEGPGQPLLTCVPINDKQGICRETPCLPENAGCEFAPCCEGLSCDPYKRVCGVSCAGTGTTCQNDWECCSNSCVGASPTGAEGTCACSLGACVLNEDCCSGACIKGACTPECNTPDINCHDECTRGPPLDKDICIPDGTKPLSETICNEQTGDPYCCCVEWDDLCIDEAVAYYGSGICSL